MSATVLVIAGDQSTELLLAEMITLAGFQPVLDVTLGAAGECLRRVRPDVVMLDAALPPAVVRACIAASQEVRAVPVLASSDASAEDLSRHSDVDGLHVVPLPGASIQLRQLLDGALAKRPGPTFNLELRSGNTGIAVHPSIRAALSSVVRARALVVRASESLADNSALQRRLRESREEMHRSRMALHAAIAEYAVYLKSREMTLEVIVSHVQSTVADCASTLGADAAAPALLLESEEWVRSAYFAA